MKISGSLQQKKGIYYTVLWINGKYKWKTTQICVSCKTKREEANNLVKAQGILAQRIEEASKQHVDICNSMFIDFINDWLERKSHDIRRCTFESYEIYMKNHITPYFAPKKLKLTDVTPIHIQKFIDNEYKSGSSPNSIKKYMVILSGAMDDAVMYNFIQYNPCKRVKMYKCIKPETTAYNVEEAVTLLEKIKGTKVETAVMLALCLGLRRSEVVGLRWKDVDLDNRIIRIRNTVVHMKTVVEAEQTKSKASKRDMQIPDILYNYLIEIKQTSNSEYVCSTEDGNRVDPNYISRTFKRTLRNNGLKEIRFHELRHTCGSILFNNGATVKQVQEYLGHERASTTLDMYVHIDDARKSETASMISNILCGD